MSHPQTDIVIPVHDALDFTRNCIETVYAHTQDFRLIIVDDFSDVPTREFLYGPDCLGRDKRNLYVRTNRQSWFTRASNLGLRMARTECVMLLNSDTVVNDGWLEELYAVKAAAEETGLKVGLVGHVGWDGGKRWEATHEPNYVTGHAWLCVMSAFAEFAAARGTPGWYFNELDQNQMHINSDRIGCYDFNRLGYATIASYQAPVGHVGGRSWNYDMARVYNVNKADLD